MQSSGTGQSNSDYHFFVSAVNDSTVSYLAWATFCMMDSTTGRPIMGQINYNIFYMTDLTSAGYIQSMDTTVHEMAHALVYSFGLFKMYRDPSGNIYGDSAIQNLTIRGLLTPHLVTPNVKQWAIDHYGCSSIVGMQLENQGSAGSAYSHWERTVAYDELMTASRLGPSKSFTGVTWAAFKDSNWYLVDDSSADNLGWGYKKGCNFFNLACQAPAADLANFPEFCYIQGTYGCNSDNSGRSVCITTNISNYFMDNCGLNVPDDTQDCINPSDAANGNLTENRIHQ